MKGQYDDGTEILQIITSVTLNKLRENEAHFSKRKKIKESSMGKMEAKIVEKYEKKSRARGDEVDSP